MTINPQRITARTMALAASLIAIAIVISPLQRAGAQFRATIGAKAWYTTWSLPLVTPGVESSNLTPALLAGPYLSLRYGKVAATVVYSTAVVTYTGSEHSDGMFFDYAFDGNVHLDRQDVNVFLNYSVTAEISLFANVKLLQYSLREARTTIYGNRIFYDQKFSGTGFGLGAQFTTAFGSGSPLYSFMSTGVFTNTIKAGEVTATFNGIPVAVDQGSDSNTELLYFLDAGLGMRIPETKLGVTFGLRVENGVDTKTAIGPTANVFYTF